MDGNYQGVGSVEVKTLLPQAIALPAINHPSELAVSAINTACSNSYYFILHAHYVNTSYKVIHIESCTNPTQSIIYPGKHVVSKEKFILQMSTCQFYCCHLKLMKQLVAAACFSVYLL